MDVNEVLVRVVRGHWRLLIVCLVMPVLAVLALSSSEERLYSASARIQAGTVLPGTETQADAMLDLVRGVATSSTVVDRALTDSGVDRDTRAVTDAIEVQRLGSSTVMDLVVTDTDPGVASSLAQELATSVVAYVNNVGDARVANLVDGLQARQQELLEQRQQVAVDLQLAEGVTARADLSARLTGLDQQLRDLASSIQQLELSGASAAGTGPASVVSPAGSADRPPDTRVADTALALLAGLVLGLLAASAAEVLRPRVAGARSVSRELGAPLLGTFVGSRRDAGDDRTAAIAATLRAAAERHGVDRLLLAGPARPRELAELSERLTAELRSRGQRHTTADVEPVANGRVRSGPEVWERGALPFPATHPATDRSTGRDAAGPVLLAAPSQVHAEGRRALDVRPLNDADRDDGGGGPGLVAVVPVLAPFAEVARLDDLSAATGWPLVGVIGVPKRSRRRASGGAR